MAKKPEFDELLDESEDSQAFEADDEPTFDPLTIEDSNVVAVEPPLIAIGRKRRKDDLRRLSEEQR